MATSNGTPTLVSQFFIIDFHLLSQLSGEEGDFDPAIIYLYPQKSISDPLKMEMGQIIGLSHFFAELVSSHPNTFHYKNAIITTISYGRHVMFLALNSERITAEESKVHLQRIIDLFHFLFGTFNEIHATVQDAKNIGTYLEKTLTPIVDYVFNLNRSIPNLFSSIKYLPLTRVTRTFALDAKHFLRYLQSKFDVQEGLIAYDHRILHTTFDNDTTYLLQSILRISHKLPDDVIRHPCGKHLKLHNGISLLRVFFPLSSSRLSNTTAISEPTSPNDVQMPIPFKPIKPSDSIVIRRTNTNNSLYESFASPFASESQVRSSRFYSSDSAAISSSETGFDTDQHEGGRYSPPQRIKRQNAVTSPIKSNTKENSLSVDSDNNSERMARSPSLLSSPRNQGSDASDSEPLDSLSNPSTLHFLEIKNDDEESGYDDQPLAYRPPYHNVYDEFRSRSRTMTNGIRPSLCPPKPRTGIPDRNNEHERDATILYVQKNSRMTVVYRLRTETPSEDYLEKLWFNTMQKLSELDGEIYTTCNFHEGEKQSTRVKFHCMQDTRAIRFDRGWQNNQCYRPMVTPETVALAFCARTKLNDETKRQMIGFARGNHSLTVDYRSKVCPTFVCQQQPKI